MQRGGSHKQRSIHSIWQASSGLTNHAADDSCFVSTGVQFLSNYIAVTSVSVVTIRQKYQGLSLSHMHCTLYDDKSFVICTIAQVVAYMLLLSTRALTHSSKFYRFAILSIGAMYKREHASVIAIAESCVI
jgi:hypothetical protein